MDVDPGQGEQQADRVAPIRIGAWQEDDGKRFACIAIQFAGHEQDGWLPKVVLVNKTTFHEHFEDISVTTP
jgi:hypothetical protein